MHIRFTSSQTTSRGGFNPVWPKDLPAPDQGQAPPSCWLREESSAAMFCRVVGPQLSAPHDKDCGWGRSARGQSIHTLCRHTGYTHTHVRAHILHTLGYTRVRCGLHWGALVYTGVHWGALGCTGLHWGTLGYTGLHWGALRYANAAFFVSCSTTHVRHIRTYVVIDTCKHHT